MISTLLLITGRISCNDKIYNQSTEHILRKLWVKFIGVGSHRCSLVRIDEDCALLLTFKNRFIWRRRIFFQGFKVAGTIIRRRWRWITRRDLGIGWKRTYWSWNFIIGRYQDQGRSIWLHNNRSNMSYSAVFIDCTVQRHSVSRCIVSFDLLSKTLLSPYSETAVNYQFENEEDN